MNKVILMGRLTRNPEIKYSQGEEALTIARYTLAVSRQLKKKGEEVDFINCVSFGKTAEIAEKYLSKGKMVSIVGRLQVHSWDADGQKRWSTEVVVEEHYFVEPKSSKDKEQEKIEDENLPF